MTMLIVTHEMNFARDVADRVIFMSGGKIVEDGPPEIVLGDPQEAETRSVPAQHPREITRPSHPFRSSH